MNHSTIPDVHAKTEQPSNQFVADTLYDATCLLIALHHTTEDIHSLGATHHLLNQLDGKICELYNRFSELAEQEEQPAPVVDATPVHANKAVLALRDKADSAYSQALSMTTLMIVSEQAKDADSFYSLNAELQSAYISTIEQQLEALKSAFDELAGLEVQP